MAKKSTATIAPAAKSPAVAPKVAAASPISSTPVRNSPLPPRAAAPASVTGRKAAPTYDQIARRAYEIWQSGAGGSAQDHWYRAERELRGA